MTDKLILNIFDIKLFGLFIIQFRVFLWTQN